MINQLIEASGGKLLVPLVFVVAGTAIIKGLAGIHGSRSIGRKDFLDLWLKRESQDDLWIEASIRHLFGEYLPAAVIRSLLSSPQSGRALREVCDSWELLDMNDETGEIYWRKEKYGNPKSRKKWILIFNICYFVLMFSTLGLIYLLLASSVKNPTASIMWFYVFIFGLGGLWCLSRAHLLSEANKSVPRWLGLK
jgi:hypothetical protein